MRKIGTLNSAPQAERFGHYLAAQGIQNRVDAAGQEWEIWVYDEEQLARCREELDAFQSSPDAKKYAVKAPPAPKPARPQRVVTASRGSERIQVTIIITALCMIVTLGTNYGKQFDVTNEVRIAPVGGDLSNILHGQVWRLFTPMFLHFNLLHLGFNIYMFWILGGVIERIRGSWTLLALILLIALPSNLIQYSLSGGSFGGLSGVVYGLFGYLWMRSVFLPEDGFYMPESIVLQMIVWAIFGLTGNMFGLTDAIGAIANGAHFGGLFTGMLIGVLPRLWKNGG